MSHHNQVHKFIPIPSDEKSGCRQGMEEARNNFSVAAEKVKSRKEVILEAQRETKESPLCYIGGHLSSQKCGVRTPISEV